MVADAVYLVLISTVPDIAIEFTRFSNNLIYLFGGTSILINVGVVLDTMRQVESHLMMRHYEGFMQKGKLKGRLA